ncbi:MAG: tRNA guanosine(15) transglycosylase TgtA [Desulfurococcales archaeon]|nr:tRNA guanosine(15) transglycosylase TgtA [Desulfurococcales archaeon]
MFRIKHVDLAGRIGEIQVKSRKIETPALFPVIDPLRQEVSANEIDSIGFKQVITNAYLTYKRFGAKAEEQGIHKIIGFDGVVMTDSGAYQLLEYGSVDIEQETVLRYQKRIGSDIGVILDVPTGNVDKEKAEQTVTETLRRARKALEIIDPLQDPIIWVLPLQGGRFLDLLEYSAKEAVKLPYRMYSLGSPTVFLEKYQYDIIGDMVYTARKILPWGKPLHLFGAGHPLLIPFMVALGVDTFDSASYILYARDNRIMTKNGVHRLEKLEYMPCSTPICLKYTPKELLEMDKNERTRLLALHNLYEIKASINETKEAIRENRLWELLREYASLHPSTYTLFDKFRKYASYLEKYTPKTPINTRGRKILDKKDTWNPIILRHLNYLICKLDIKVDNIIIVPEPEDRAVPGKNNVFYFKPIIGLIPSNLSRTYPYPQISYPPILDWESCEWTKQVIITFLIKKNIKHVKIAITDKNMPCLKYIANSLKEKISKKGITVEILSLTHA